MNVNHKKMRTIKRRKELCLQIAALAVVGGVYLGGRWRWVDGIIVLYFLFLSSYAWNMTKKCPLAIMMAFPVVKWPHAFRLMYKQRATQMMGLYFTCAGIVVVKTGVMVHNVVQWIVEKWA
jgi:hypothetical protein